MHAWLIIALALMLAYALGYLVGGFAEVARQVERETAALARRCAGAAGKEPPRATTASSRASAARVEGTRDPSRAPGHCMAAGKKRAGIAASRSRWSGERPCGEHRAAAAEKGETGEDAQ